jgi:hypothetical protein
MADFLGIKPKEWNKKKNYIKLNVMTIEMKIQACEFS